MYLHPEAKRLLDDIQHAHTSLIAHFDATDAQRRGFRAVYEALEAAVGDMQDDALQAPLEDGGWSPLRVLHHLHEHDQAIEEATRRGIEHMIEHGLDHARTLWQAKMTPEARGGGD